jgi:hypothetical protein
MKRWVCPVCGKGVNAPSRMGADDVRRFCLPCSKSTGKLVRRTAPALERERAAARERSTRKQQGKRKAVARRRGAQKARDDARRYIMGQDVQTLCRRWYRLKAWDRSVLGPFGLAGMPKRTPELVVRRGNKDYISAHASAGRHRITMTVPKSWTEPTPKRVADLLMTIVHELAHLFAPYDNHGDKYQRQFCTAVRAIWGEAVTDGVVSGPRGYALTRLFTKRLTAVLQAKETAPESAHGGSQGESEGNDE